MKGVFDLRVSFNTYMTETHGFSTGAVSVAIEVAVITRRESESTVAI